MNLTERIQREMVQAAKAQDKLRLSALRMVRAALHNREIDLKKSLTDPEVEQVLSTLAKQRKDSMEQFRRGNRQDLVDKEENELRIIQGFMPTQLSEQDISAQIETILAEVGAVSTKDMGKVMKALMPRLAGRADGKVVGELVKARLAR